MKILFKKSFDKSYQKLDEKIKTAFKTKLGVFTLNPLTSTLRNHALNGKYEGKRSIDITGDFRAVFIEYPSGTYEFVEFVDIGTHSQLYK